MLRLSVSTESKGFIVIDESKRFVLGDSGNSIKVLVEVKSIDAITAKYGGILDLLDNLVDSQTLDPLVDSEDTRYLEES